MSDTVKFMLDGVEVTAKVDESLWEIAKRQGTLIPHLCHKDAAGYRSDGNCRACMVEIEGERTLAASCIRTPVDGMVVNTQNARSVSARKLVIEMLVTDQPAQDKAHDQTRRMISPPTSGIWHRCKTSVSVDFRRLKNRRCRCLMPRTLP